MYSTEQVKGLHESWKWILGTGICLALLGLSAIAMSGVTTVVSVITVGVVFLVGGLAHIVNAIATRKNRGALPHGLIGVLYGIAGYMLLAHPLRGALTLTFVIAALLFASGIAKVVLSFEFRKMQFSVFTLINGLISAFLGTLIFLQWPASAIWVIGTFVGITLLMDGFSLTTLGLTVKRLTPPSAERKETPVEAR